MGLGGFVMLQGFAFVFDPGHNNPIHWNGFNFFEERSNSLVTIKAVPAFKEIF